MEWTDLSSAELTARLTEKTDLGDLIVQRLVNDRDDDKVALLINHILEGGHW